MSIIYVVRISSLTRAMRRVESTRANIIMIVLYCVQKSPRNWDGTCGLGPKVKHLTILSQRSSNNMLDNLVKVMNDSNVITTSN